MYRVLRVSYSGNTPVFQTGVGGSIPPTRSKDRISRIYQGDTPGAQERVVLSPFSLFSLNGYVLCLYLQERGIHVAAVSLIFLSL